MRENGKPCAASDVAVNRSRAEISIEVYHLHHDPTCKLRHSSAVQLLSDIEEAKGYFLASQADATQEPAFKKTAERILRAINAESPFSGDMHFLLRGERDVGHPWIQDLLETN